ncbi:Sec-independent protein translocase protein [Corynebacterium resistens DSM 45100]|uniref:Sec-independent protein translocase protein n=2 Tax=Corynebacterium resistens TaxID=258224 RepID=F8E260_CORRG|nr:Sec-independent protein translocase protein [Corynebacterium resistens DSM 45100]
MKSESDQRKGAIAPHDPQAPIAGETPEQSAARLQANQQAQPVQPAPQQPVQPQQGAAQPVDPNTPQQP